MKRLSSTSFLLILASLLVTTVAAHADQHSSIPNLPVVSDSDGEPVPMFYDNVGYACAGYGVATIRQLALWATQYGAKVSETPQNGFDKIQGTDAVGNLDTFYYQHSEYKAPKDMREWTQYWSGSFLTGNPNNVDLVLYGYDGSIGTVPNVYGSNSEFSVRCKN